MLVICIVEIQQGIHLLHSNNVTMEENVTLSLVYVFIYVCVQVEFFEPFWDSGEARIGEFGARGWKAWMVQQERGGWIQPSAGKTHTLGAV